MRWLGLTLGKSLALPQNAICRGVFPDGTFDPHCTSFSLSGRVVAFQFATNWRSEVRILWFRGPPQRLSSSVE